MGKINSEPQKQTPTSSTHFSHPHPLITIDSHKTNTLSASCCSGCNLKPSGTIYSCTTCSFILHKACFDMPKKITHPCDKQHAFTLLPEPAYPDGLFNCDACGKTGNRFSYHCKPCGVDLHILCAAMPLSVTHISHAHKLDLSFKSPYASKSFACDICKTNGADHWFYRCNTCGFDAHLNCARQPAPPLQQAATTSRSAPMLPHSHPGAAVPHQYPIMPQNVSIPYPVMNNAAVGLPAGGPMMNMDPYGVNRAQYELLVQAIQQMANSNNAIAQAMLSGRGFGGGDMRGLQQMMQLLSGGGGIPGGLMNAFGGGGGLDFLGGGNGLDLLGGGGFDIGGLLGGGGGFDLGGLLGGFGLF